MKSREVRDPDLRILSARSICASGQANHPSKNQALEISKERAARADQDGLINKPFEPIPKPQLKPKKNGHAPHVARVRHLNDQKET